MPVCFRHPDRESHVRCQRCGRPICPDCMQPAAVGFQCPSCVRQGSRETRQGRTPYGGRVSSNPALTVQVLILLNLAVWVLIVATGGGRSPWLYRLALLPDSAIARTADGDIVPITGVSDGAYWQLFTSIFTHVDVWHIGFNMLALWFLGPQLEAALGRLRFLALYLMSGLAGSALVYWLAPLGVPTIGASGAIFGFLGALLVVVLKMRGDPSQLLVWIGLNFVITVLGRAFISWQGHLGGFLGGVTIAAILVFAPRRQRTLWQVLGVGLVGAAIAVAVVTRTLALS